MNDYLIVGGKKMINTNKILNNCGVGTKQKKLQFQIGDKVWYKGRKVVVADRLNNMYSLWDESGTKEIKGEVDGWWVQDVKLALRD